MAHSEVVKAQAASGDGLACCWRERVCFVSKKVPSRIMAYKSPARRRAMAVMATCLGLRSISLAKCLASGVSGAVRTRVQLACISKVRICALPALVIPRSLRLPPVVFSRGVSPRYEDIFATESKRSALSSVATKQEAVSRPKQSHPRLLSTLPSYLLVEKANRSIEGFE